MENKGTAIAFLEEWRECSREMLKALAPGCPDSPGEKVRPWKIEGGPIGLLLHYTGGPNGVASIRWANENPANQGSSWHATVFDCRLPQLDRIRERYALVSRFLPVTAILHANVAKGTWHGNWTNGYTFGLENRNLGRLTESKGQIYRAAGSAKYFVKDGKQPVLIRGQWWEPFSREQLEANINIGKALRSWREDLFEPSWVIPHSLAWGSKSDTGSAYPLSAVRDAIFSAREVSSFLWLSAYESAISENFEEIDNGVAGSRDQEELAKMATDLRQFDAANTRHWRDFLNTVRENLRLLGAYCPPTDPLAFKELDSNLKLATSIFQRSTHAKGYKGEPLKPDGVPGEKTRNAIAKRLIDFGYGQTRKPGT